MTQPTNFKSLNVKTTLKTFRGDKIEIKRVFNKKIIVNDYKIEPSKFEGQCLYISIILNDEPRVIFTSSKMLADQIQQIDKSQFPIETIIVDDEGLYKFT